MIEFFMASSYRILYNLPFRITNKCSWKTLLNEPRINHMLLPVGGWWSQRWQMFLVCDIRDSALGGVPLKRHFGSELLFF
jgi:hypothetical protein